MNQITILIAAALLALGLSSLVRGQSGPDGSEAPRGSWQISTSDSGAWMINTATGVAYACDKAFCSRLDRRD
jgi:hypothetical protein